MLITVNPVDGNRIRTVRRRLTGWWEEDNGGLLFPWRSREISPYQALIIEVLLQRTRAEAVNRMQGEFFRMFPEPKALCSASEKEIQNAINSLGLSWRARKLRELGCAIVNGIPDKMDDLVGLPGVGPYAAGAYLSFHRGKRAIIPDANMVRILGRLFGFQVTPETRRSRAFLEFCDRVTPKRNFRDFNYAVLDFGRLICKPRKPLCSECFLNDVCEYAGLHSGKGGKVGEKDDYI